MPGYDKNFKKSSLFSFALCCSLPVSQEKNKTQYFLSVGDSLVAMKFLVWSLHVCENRYSTLW